MFLNELTDGDSTTYSGKLFCKLVTHTVKKLIKIIYGENIYKKYIKGI